MQPPVAMRTGSREEVLVTDLYAYSFQSPLSMAKVLERLNDPGSWRWIERDNDNWGKYISARVLRNPHDVMIKLIRDEGRYIINIYLRSNQPDAGAEFAAVRDMVFQQVLPALDDSVISKTDDI
jgi:hypothetical protein